MPNGFKIINEDGTERDLSKDSTSQEIKNTIGQESGQTVLSKLQNIWNKLTSLFDNGEAKVKLWDGTTVAKVSETGRQLIDTSPPAPPEDTTAVNITAYSNVAGQSDSAFLIPNGTTLKIQRLSGGSQPAGGSNVELWYDINGTGIGMQIIDVIFSDGQSDQHDLNAEYEGNGSRRIIMRRTGIGSANARLIFGRWEGYYA